MGNTMSTKTVDPARGKELKALLDQHMAEFIKLHCHCDPTCFVPIAMLKAAWLEYCDAVEATPLLREYYNHGHNHLNGALFFGDAIIVHNDMYLGIRLTSWPTPGTFSKAVTEQVKLLDRFKTPNPGCFGF